MNGWLGLNCQRTSSPTMRSRKILHTSFSQGFFFTKQFLIYVSVINCDNLLKSDTTSELKLIRSRAVWLVSRSSAGTEAWERTLCPSLRRTLLPPWLLFRWVQNKSSIHQHWWCKWVILQCRAGRMLCNWSQRNKDALSSDLCHTRLPPTTFFSDSFYQ